MLRSDPAAGAVAAAPDTTRRAGVLGLGTALPETVVPNEDIAARIGVDSEWIVRRTGISERRRLRDDERLSDLAIEAGRLALEDAGQDPAQIDMVLVATVSQDEVMPNSAPVVAAGVGANGAGALDVGAACSGFVSTLALAAGLIESGRSERILLVGADALSRWTDPEDKRTASLFGDGAGAVVLAAQDGGGVGPSVIGADGGMSDLLIAPRDALIRMDGLETFKQAVRRMGESTEQVLEAASLTHADIDLFVYHQANRRILASLAEHYELDTDKVVDAIGALGNTSAASVPLALEQSRAAGQLRPGAKVLLGAAGAGFTWSAALLEWGTA